jgi:DNA-binding transcriptional ArsR family regulator
MPRQQDRRPDPGPERSVPLSVVKADLFKALAHPARVRVLELLADGEQSVGQMQPLVGVELSHLSQQLGVLRRAGLVTARREGSAVFYAISDPLVVELLGVAKQLLLHSLDATRELLADLSADIASS